MSYRPGVRAILETLRRGGTIDRIGVQTGYNPRSGSVSASFYTRINDRIVTRKEESDIDEAKRAGLLSFDKAITGNYSLTEKGQDTYLDFKGNEVDKDWTPPPPKPPTWDDRAEAYLFPSTDTLLIIDCLADRLAYRNSVGLTNPEPWLQIPGWDFKGELSREKAGGYIFKSFQDWREEKTCKGGVLSFLSAAKKYGWEVETLREVEGYISDRGVGIKQHNRWVFAEAWDCEVEELNAFLVGKNVTELVVDPILKGAHDHDIFDDFGSDEARAANRYLGLVKGKRAKDGVYFRAHVLIKTGAHPIFDIEILEVRRHESASTPAV